MYYDIGDYRGTVRHYSKTAVCKTIYYEGIYKVVLSYLREKISNLTVTSPRPCNLQAEIFHRFCVQDDFSGEERFKQVFRPRRVYFERLVNESTAWSNAEKIWKFRRLLDTDLVSTGLPTG